ncbi:MAG: 50S ribosomal protein L1 [Dehalococcoidia bacterium]|nr:50S ribosomal protein L1 [Dehalococcoidia bacterium]
MAKHGKKYLEAAKKVEATRSYTPGEAIELAKQAVYVKFDETVELHLKMGIDPRQSNQQVRGIAVLPHGLGKKVRILVLTQGEAVKTAKEAGADYVGAEDLIKKIEEGWIDFDVAMATPDIMSKVGKLGKVLGRRGLMPNPKAGTVVTPENLPRAISEATKGRVEFKLDRTAIIHVALGKASFTVDKLTENLSAIVEAINKAKPSGAKGQYIQSAYITTTMGPGLRLDLKPLLSARTA